MPWYRKYLSNNENFNNNECDDMKDAIKFNFAKSSLSFSLKIFAFA